MTLSSLQYIEKNLGTEKYNKYMANVFPNASEEEKIKFIFKKIIKKIKKYIPKEAAFLKFFNLDLPPSSKNFIYLYQQYKWHKAEDLIIFHNKVKKSLSLEERAGFHNLMSSYRGSEKAKQAKEDFENHAELLAAVRHLNCNLEFGEDEEIISRLPKAIRYFTNLQTLNLSRQTNIRLPKEIIALKNLKTLDLSSCSYRKISKKIGKLSSLRHLYLQNNELTSLPAEISRLQTLKKVDISFNNFRSIPVQLHENNPRLDLKYGGNPIEMSGKYVSLIPFQRKSRRFI